MLPQIFLAFQLVFLGVFVLIQ